MQDGQIINLCNTGKFELAFNGIVDSYSERLYWHVRRFVCSHEDTNDLLQDIFIKIWSSLPSFRGDAKIYTWLYRIAINETLTFLDRRKTTIPLDSLEADTVEQLEGDIYFNGDSADAHIQAAIQTLPPRQRMVFNMRYYEDISYEEMSAIFGTSIESLKTSYHIATKKIEEYLKENC